MNRVKTFTFLLLFVFVSLAAGQEGDPLQLTPDNYKAWMRHIQPSEDELKWRQIDWQPDLKTGIAKAAESGKPILLWTMNGHPFGCT